MSSCLVWKFSCFLKPKNIDRNQIKICRLENAKHLGVRMIELFAEEQCGSFKNDFLYTLVINLISTVITLSCSQQGF